ncbi:MAG: ADP-glyceromanno-heptose 6-epimerase [Candidatus Omnitrophota bacterium]|nr:MAG: ADP-glyceromanno-heptose 6-epimerase [Candidatus Omnitrophota bacterium]
MKVLITGGSGFIGSNIARLLKEEGIDVIIFDDFSHADFKNILDLECEVICSDILEESLEKKIPKVDAVIHQAAVTDTTLKDDRKILTVNFVGFKNILNFCIKRKIRLIYASSAGVYGKGPTPMRETQTLSPLNSYSYSKYLCDREVSKFFRKSPIPIVGLRYFNVYGPGESHKGKSSSMIFQLYLQMKEDKSPRVFKYGEQRRDFVYVKDVAYATFLALNVSKTVIVNVGKGEARSFNEVISVINKVLNKNLQPEYFDNPYQEVYQEFTQADITLLQKLLKFTPGYSLEEGIEDYIENYLTKGI